MKKRKVDKKVTCNKCKCPGSGHEWVCGDFCDVGGVKTYFLFCKWCALTKQTGIMP
jgi:hypothetical protein